MKSCILHALTDKEGSVQLFVNLRTVKLFLIIFYLVVSFTQSSADEASGLNAQHRFSTVDLVRDPNLFEEIRREPVSDRVLSLFAQLWDVANHARSLRHNLPITHEPEVYRSELAQIEKKYGDIDRLIASGKIAKEVYYNHYDLERDLAERLDAFIPARKKYIEQQKRIDEIVESGKGYFSTKADNQTVVDYHAAKGKYVGVIGSASQMPNDGSIRLLGKIVADLPYNLPKGHIEYIFYPDAERAIWGLRERMKTLHGETLPEKPEEVVAWWKANAHRFARKEPAQPPPPVDKSVAAAVEKPVPTVVPVAVTSNQSADVWMKYWWVSLLLLPLVWVGWRRAR